MPIHDSNSTDEFDNTKVVKTPFPFEDIVYRDIRLQNNGTENMDVNGSLVSPIDFIFQAQAGETWYVENISMLIFDGGTTDIDDFGAINNGLTNGCQLLIQTKGTEYEIGNFTNNASLSLCFSDHGVIPGASAGWLNDNDGFVGSKAFNHSMKLNGDQGDYIKLRIRDDIRGLDFFQMLVRLFRKV